MEFGHEICSHFLSATAREWLVTNGIGGYAAGTIAGTLTRRYHGLLIAALQPPLERTLLVTKLDEIAQDEENNYHLSTDRWASGAVAPQGFRYLQYFHLESGAPVWTFALADALLEKRIWMQPGANTTYVQYRLLRGNHALRLNIKGLVNYRGHHGSTRANGWKMQIQPVPRGLSLTAFEQAEPFYLLSDKAQATPQHQWYCGYFLSLEDYRGLDAQQDHLFGGLLEYSLSAGESLTVVASTLPDPELDGDTAWADWEDATRRMLNRASNFPKNKAVFSAKQIGKAILKKISDKAENPPAGQLPEIRQLLLAADQFIVGRALPDHPGGKTIIAGYPWFGDWGRDTMIALPGLTLAAGRPEIARDILGTFARYLDQGMLPNRFPEIGQQPEYNTVDATLWYFEALRAYHQHTGDTAFLDGLFSALTEIIDWHCRGTRYHIHMDAQDGLLYAGQDGVQLTWMDAKVGDWVVTPRTGKAVEINALWYNALRIMAEFSALLGHPPARFSQLAGRVEDSFSHFWNPDTGYCFDVLDGPDGNDPALRPNQLLAVSLPSSPLSASKQRAVVDVCARHLLTPHGMRSLSPQHPAYRGTYGGDQHQRDSAYHQGTVWGWLLGPFVQAHLRVYHNPALARSFLEPLIQQIHSHGVGSLSEIFDGDPPFTPRGCPAQAWSVAEALRVWQLIEHWKSS